LVSESFFSGSTVEIRGLPWCKDEPRRIGLASAKSKILCKSHNTALSDLDAEIGRFMDHTREIGRIAYERRGIPRKAIFATIRRRVSALLLERWLVKTLVNLLEDGSWFFNGQALPVRMSRDSLARIAFGLDKFQGGAGLYVGTLAGHQFQLVDKLQLRPILFDGELVAGAFSIAGLLWLLNLDPATRPTSLSHLSTMPDEWRLAQFKRPYTKMVTKNRSNVWHVIEFEW